MYYTYADDLIVEEVLDDAGDGGGGGLHVETTETPLSNKNHSPHLPSFDRRLKRTKAFENQTQINDE